MKELIRRMIRRVGFDLYRYPRACERLMPHLQVLLASRRIDAVIDVGANEGQFALALREIDRDVRIHSVEPNAAAFVRLAQHAQQDAAWTTHACALGRESGEITLTVSASSAFSSCLTANAYGQQQFPRELAAVDHVVVPLRTLDELVDTLPDVPNDASLLVKLDTQGFDLEVLRGAATVLMQTQIVVAEAALRPIYERAALLPELLDFLTSRGFVLSGFFPVSRDTEHAVIEADCVFVRAR